eukprot:g5772.t1
MDMTKEALRQTCKDKKLYTTPSYNDKLYLHYRGFRRIENLEEYTALRVIWLEGNGLTKIEGLEHQTEMRTLYLQENLIEKIENVSHLTHLDSLNLAQNNIKRVEGISMLPKLQNLHLKNNHLKTADDLRHCVDCPALTTLDIQSNKIAEPDGLLDVLASMRTLRVLYLQGNEVVKKIKHYRKAVTWHCKNLRYLDDRPVFPEDRLRVEAWGRVFYEQGGTAAEALEAERAEVKRQQDEKRARELSNSAAFDAMVRRAHEKARLKRAASARASGMGGGAEDGNVGAALLQAAESNLNIFSGEAIVPSVEGKATRRAREQRWARIIDGEGGGTGEADADADAVFGGGEQEDELEEETEEERRLYELCRTVGNPQAAATAQAEEERQARRRREAAAPAAKAPVPTQVAAPPPPPAQAQQPPAPPPVSTGAPGSKAVVDVGVDVAVPKTVAGFTDMEELD